MNMHFCEEVMKLNWFFYENIQATYKIKTEKKLQFRQTDKQTD